MNCCHRRTFCPLLLILLTWGAAGRSHAGFEFRTVGLTGKQAAGAPAGVKFNYFEGAVLDASGRVAFWGFTDSVEPLHGVWSEGTGALAPVTRYGAQAPGFPPGYTFYGRSNLVMSASGQTAFESAVLWPDNSTYSHVVWSEGSGTLTAVAREGGEAPGAPVGAKFDGLVVSPSINANGRVAFSGTWLVEGDGGVPSSNGGGVWTDRSGTLELAYRAGDQAPGTPAGAKFLLVGPAGINAAGQMVLTASLQQGSGGVTSSNEYGIWSEGTGALALVARQGSQAPGVPVGGNFSIFNNPALNSAGRTAFSAELRTGSGGVTSANDSGIWSEGGGSLALAAREGSQAPGVPVGANFGSFSVIYPNFNGSGQIAFAGSLQATGGGVTIANDTGVWSGGTGTLKLVAREGGQAPGAPAGALFESFGSPALNAAGRTAFHALLHPGGGGVTPSNNESIWMEDFFGALRLVAREGQLFEAAPGDFRTISSLQFGGVSGLERGRENMSNDNFTLVFQATFTNGSSGVFTATAVPEPHAWLLAMTGAGTWRLARRRRAL